MNTCSHHLTLIDIGALGGLEVPWKHSYFKQAIQFEPNSDPEVQSSLSSTKTLLINRAVSSVDDSIKNLYIYGNLGSGSSLLEQNYEWVTNNLSSVSFLGDQQLAQSWFERSALRSVQQVRTVTLDSICQLNNISPDRPCFVKCDTQGSEWEVLQGAHGILSDNTCIGLELELFRFPMYKEITLEHHIISHLFDLGFSLVGWSGYKNTFNSQADYLFLKNPERLNQIQLKMRDEIQSLYSPTKTHNLIKRTPLMKAIVRAIKTLS